MLHRLNQAMPSLLPLGVQELPGCGSGTAATVTMVRVRVAMAGGSFAGLSVSSAIVQAYPGGTASLEPTL